MGGGRYAKLVDINNIGFAAAAKARGHDRRPEVCSASAGLEDANGCQDAGAQARQKLSEDHREPDRQSALSA